MMKKALAALGALMLVLRIVYVIEVPDLDTDAYGHFHIGRALVDTPQDIQIHWVWLPGWHFVLMMFQRAGIEFQGVRIAQAILATIGPLLVYVHARQERHLAALLFTLVSLANLAGTSALMEVAFTFLLLGAAISLDRPTIRASILAGVLVASACSIRYEAWFVVLGLGIELLVHAIKTRRIDSKLIVAFVIPATCLVAYILVRRFTDGEWLWFIRETYRFTHMQRGLSTHSAIFELAWFPIILPFMVLGPAMVLIPFSSWKIRRSTVVPLSLLAFLLLTYVGKGALGQARYLTVLMPYACIAMASAVARFSQYRAKLIALAIVSIAGSLVFMVVRTASSALAREAELHDLQRWAESPRSITPSQRASEPPP